jgi:hypothetical protein
MWFLTPKYSKSNIEGQRVHLDYHMQIYIISKLVPYLLRLHPSAHWTLLYNLVMMKSGVVGAKIKNPYIVLAILKQNISTSSQHNSEHTDSE